MERDELVRVIYAELERQGEGDYLGGLDEATGEVVIDGEYNLHELAKVILAAFGSVG